MAGAEHGGAELFFERLAIAFQGTGMTQQLMIKPIKDRISRLTAAGIHVTGCRFSPLLAAVHRRQIVNAIHRSKPDRRAFVFIANMRILPFCDQVLCDI